MRYYRGADRSDRRLPVGECRKTRKGEISELDERLTSKPSSSPVSSQWKSPVKSRRKSIRWQSRPVAELGSQAFPRQIGRCRQCAVRSDDEPRPRAKPCAHSAPRTRSTTRSENHRGSASRSSSRDEAWKACCARFGRRSGKRRRRSAGRARKRADTGRRRTPGNRRMSGVICLLTLLSARCDEVLLSADLHPQLPRNEGQ